MEDDVQTDHDAVIEFATYEDFLDSQINSTDLYYLEVSLICLLLVFFFTDNDLFIGILNWIDNYLKGRGIGTSNCWARLSRQRRSDKTRRVRDEKAKSGRDETLQKESTTVKTKYILYSFDSKIYLNDSNWKIKGFYRVLAKI